MNIKRFRILRYKCFTSDSNWIEVDPLTVIVGKNESGKTTLLKALHKFNPFLDEKYDIDNEWPRGYRNEKKSTQEVCIIQFELNKEELEYLEINLKVKIKKDYIEISKLYNGDFDFKLDNCFDVIPSENNIVSDVIENKEDTKNIKDKIKAYIKQKIPTFIYMSDYKIFQGSSNLYQLIERKNRKQLTEEDTTILTILELSGLKLEELIKSSNQSKEQRQYDLDDASNTLTRQVSDRWKQREYQIEYRGDGEFFYTFIKDKINPFLIKLEERSKGFQWFFSFDLLLMHESKGTYKDCVILLDEPGLHLHPDAQMNLLKRLEDYGLNNTLIYTTHLPFMIDLQKPERIRILSDTTNGVTISEDLYQSEKEAKFVLQAALGMSGASSYLLSKLNLVVEGVDDFLILTELSNLLYKSELIGFPDDLFITPAGGASEAVYISTFMIGQKLNVITLLDSDEAGFEAKNKLINKWLTKYQDNKAVVLMVGDISDKTEQKFALEDLFQEDFYLERVFKLYENELLLKGIKKNKDIRLPKGDLLCKRVEKYLLDLGIQFNKGSIAKIIKRDLRIMKSVGELPEKTKELVLKLFEKINLEISKLLK